MIKSIRFSFTLVLIFAALLSVLQSAWAWWPDRESLGTQPKVVSWKPEGDQISVYVSNADGSSPTRVVSVDMKYNHPLFTDFISLSPNERQVLYVTADNTALLDAEMWIAQADGSGTTKIAHFTEGLWSAAPIWSPDGTQIAFVKKVPDSQPDEGLQL